MDSFIIFFDMQADEYGFQSGKRRSRNGVLSGGFGGTARPFMPHPWLFCRPIGAMTIPSKPSIKEAPFPSPFSNPTHFHSFIHTKLIKAFQSSLPNHLKLISDSHHYQYQSKLDMKMSSSASKRRLSSSSSSSSRGLGGVLKEQRARLYIIRRCVVMLLCWHD